VEERRGFSDLILPELVVEGRRYDLIYVDGAHTSMAVAADAVLALRLLNAEGFIIFDDWDWGGGKTKSGAPLAGENSRQAEAGMPGGGSVGGGGALSVAETHLFLERLTVGILERVHPCGGAQACFRKTRLLDSELASLRDNARARADAQQDDINDESMARG
jgi:hypothetical protein